MFEIILTTGDKPSDFVTSYKSNIVPVVGDYISLSEDESFVVKGRLLPSNDNMKVCLVGVIE